MLPKIDISDIEYAELILFGRTGCFDEERRTFLLDFTTIDLQAVPGSGKTTVLLAKLLIIERYLPLEHGAGVAILSHTNVAVDEIAAKIKVHCPKLFSYPNYIGTIQGFVDQFLAVPFYEQRYNSGIVRIDNEIYEQVYMANLAYCLPKMSKVTYNKVLHIKGANPEQLLSYRFCREGNDTFLIKGLNKNRLKVSKPRGRTKKENYRDWTAEEKLDVIDYLNKMKSRLLLNGILHFDDAYFLADVYLQKVPELPELFKQRFPFVFVDEMQDMEKHQHDILEKLFFDTNNKNCFQRIGDVNQGIFGEQSPGTKSIWRARERVLNISGSHRLRPKLAGILSAFGAVADVEIKGLRKGVDLCPHLIVFQPDSISKVIQKFGEIISIYLERGLIVLEEQHPIKVIGWNGKESNEGKIRINDYFPSYTANFQVNRVDHERFIDYLPISDGNLCSFSAIRKKILNALLKLFRIQGNLPPSSTSTKRNFLNSIKYNFPEMHNELLLNIYLCTLHCLKGNREDGIKLMSTYLPEMVLNVFGVNLNNAALKFLDFKSSKSIAPEVLPRVNIFEHNNLTIHVGTIHSVKGETHTATLYLDTCYHELESVKSLEQLKGKNACNEKSVRKRESSMMMYVGFSRPTQLLCYAVPSGNLDSHESILIDRGWEIIKI